MELDRYVAARQRVDQLIADLNLLELEKDAQDYRPGLRPEREIPTYEPPAEDAFNTLAEAEQSNEARVRARIREILKAGGLTTVLPSEPISMLEQVQVRYYSLFSLQPYFL